MAYIGKSPSNGIRNRFIYTATAGQATFSGTDDHNRTLSYTDAEFTDVFLNGVKLDKSDYTATSGTSIVLDEAAAAGDTLEVLNFDTFSVFSGEFSQDVTVGGATTLSGDLTVDTNTLHVDSTNNRVGIGASPSSLLHIEVDERTAYDGSATDGQLNVGSTLFLEQSGGNNNAISQIVFQPRTGYGYNRIVNTGGSSPKMAFVTNNAERMRIDNSGNVLVGTTDSFPASSGENASGIAIGLSQSVFSKDGGAALFVNRGTSDGVMMQFRKSGIPVGSIGSVSGDIFFAGVDDNHAALRFAASSKTVLPVTTAGALSDNSTDLGQSNARFDDIYATNGTIQTSDENEKQQIASLTNAEITAAKAISTLFKTFKWNEKVEAKGDAARTHTGVIAQDVQQAMTDAGLDAGGYAFFISTTWWETQTEVPAVEADEENGIEAADAHTRTDTYDTAEEAPEGATERTRLGIRYPELLAFVGAATEQRLANIETRLTALEAE